MPLPTPNDHESQSDFMARCMPAVENDSSFPTQDQRVAVCLTQYRRNTKGVKVLNEDQGVLGGWGIPFGGPVVDPDNPAGKDLDGEFFDEKTNFCFEWFPEEGRPVLYDHGIDKDVALTPVGKQVSKFIDPQLGVWVEVQLDMANRYAKAILELAKKGVLAYSSGALAGYVRRGKGGHLEQWPYIEQTVTVRPANPYALIAADAVKHLKEADMLPPELGRWFEPPPESFEEAVKAVLSTEARNDLPDSAFADPKNRKYPHHTASGAVDKSHLRNAMARAVQNNAPESVIAHLRAHERELGIGEAGHEGKTQEEIEVEEALKAVSAHLEAHGWKQTKANMTARSMGQMHQSLKALEDMHSANCDMGKDCPMYDGTTKTADKPGDPAEESRRQEIDDILAGIELRRGDRYVQ